jgi:hypothetical protein
MSAIAPDKTSAVPIVVFPAQCRGNVAAMSRAAAIRKSLMVLAFPRYPPGYVAGDSERPRVSPP